MAPFRRPLDDYHDQTEPNDWLEALTKAYVGDSIADDFVREVAAVLATRPRPGARGAARLRYADFAADEIRQALADDPSAGNRLSMWARRLVGEALSPGAAGRRRASGAGRPAGAWRPVTGTTSVERRRDAQAR